MISNAQRAEILVRALPYIKQYNGKTIVVKYGGNAMINEDLKNDVMKDLVLLSTIGIKVVLVQSILYTTYRGKVKMKVTQSCPTLCDPMDYIVHGIL